MIDRIFDRFRKPASPETRTTQETHYHITVQDGERFWTGEIDYKFWEGASMLDMKRLVDKQSDGTKKTISMIALQTYEKPWQKEGILERLKEDGIEVLFVESEEAIRNTTFPTLK